MYVGWMLMSTRAWTLRIALIVAFAGLSLIVAIFNQHSQKRDNEELFGKIENALDRRFSNFENQILTQVQKENVLSKDIFESIRSDAVKTKSEAIAEIRRIVIDPGHGGTDSGAFVDPVDRQKK